MGTIGRRIEEEIRQRIACEMCRIGHFRREDQTRGVDTSMLRMGAQALLRRGRGAQQPEHATRHAAENDQPALEGETRDLMHAIEAAEDRPRFRQPHRLACRRFRSHGALPVIRLVARQAQHLLGVVDLVRGRDDPVIGDDILVVGAAHAARKAEPIDDDRGGPQGEQLGPPLAGIAVHIDQDLNAVIGDAARGRGIVHAGEIGPVIDARLIARLQGVILHGRA